MTTPTETIDTSAYVQAARQALTTLEAERRFVAQMHRNEMEERHSKMGFPVVIKFLQEMNNEFQVYGRDNKLIVAEQQHSRLNITVNLRDTVNAVIYKIVVELFDTEDRVYKLICIYGPGKGVEARSLPQLLTAISDELVRLMACVRLPTDDQVHGCS